MPKGRNGPPPSGSWTAAPVARIHADIHGVFAEVDDGQGADEEGDQHGDGEQRHHGGDHEGQLDAVGVRGDEDDVARDPEHRLPFGRRAEDRREIGADEVDDHRRRQHVFDVLGHAGDEAAPGAEGGAGEGIGAAGMRQRRAHLGDGEGEAEKHDGDEKRAAEHAAPAAHGEAEVPAREVAGDDRGDAERPQIEDAGVTPELPVLEIVDPCGGVGHPAFRLAAGFCVGHGPVPRYASPRFGGDYSRSPACLTSAAEGEGKGAAMPATVAVPPCPNVAARRVPADRGSWRGRKMKKPRRGGRGFFGFLIGGNLCDGEGIPIACKHHTMNWRR